MANSISIGMANIEDYRWLCSPAGKAIWKSVLERSHLSDASILSWLRSQLNASHASIVMQQRELFDRALRKFSDPELWYWTKVLLEQASDEETARETARDFEPTSMVQDVCAGAGADSIAIAKRCGEVAAFDLCPIACELTKHNLSSHHCHGQVTQQAAEQLVISPQAFVHIDPDRRVNGNRTRQLEAMSPSLPTIATIHSRARGVSLKLAPGLRSNESQLGRERDVVLQPDSKRFLSNMGVVRQQRWYWGIDRWPLKSVVLSMYLNQPAAQRAGEFRIEAGNTASEVSFRLEEGWFHEWYPRDLEWNSRFTIDVVTDELLEFIGDYDACVRASQLSPAFAQRHGCQLIGSDSGYLTSMAPIIHPMIRWFRVLDHLALDRKKLKSITSTMRVREWELKSRGIDLDLDSLRRLLPVDAGSDQRATILFTRIGKQHRAVICT